MNENVVKALCVCTSERTISKCSKICPYHNVQDCRTKLMIDAADAIKEMSHEIDIDNAAMTAMDAAMPRWIPATEELPKTRESILGKKSSKVIVAFRFNDGTQGTDTAHTLNGEWVFEDHITVVERTITHWMPLPTPPKEET